MVCVSNDRIRSLVWALVCFSSIFCFSAETASVHGTIRDARGAPLSRIRVTARLLGAATERGAVTDQKGHYRLEGVSAGNYTISAMVPGSGTFEALCDVHANSDSQCDITLSGQSSPTSEGVIGATTVRDLPMNGRDVTQAATLQAGVSSVRTQQNAADAGSGRGQRGFGQQVSLSGARPQQNNYILDGITTNDYANSAPGSVLGLELGADAVERIAVNTSSYPAQNGRSSGGVIRAVTRSGSDAFHGSIYEFLRNSALDASNYFDHPKPSFRRNQFGAAAGLALWPNHTYIFANYEGLRQSLGITRVDTVLSDAARHGRLSTGTVTVDPLVVPYLGLFPLPNGGLLPGADTGIFRFSGQQVTGEDYFTTRVDHTLNSNDKLSGTYAFDRARTIQPDELDFKLTGLRTRRQVVSLSESHLLKDGTVFSSRIGVNRVEAVIGDNPGIVDSRAADTSLGFLPGLTPGKVVVVGVTSFPGGLNSTNVFNFHWTSFQGYEDVALKKGRHNVTLGVAVERTRDNMAATSHQHGEYVFQSLQDFLTNRPFGLTLEIPGSSANRGLRQTILGAYAQDDLSLGSKLTITLGARYETASVPTDVHDRLAALRHIQDPLPHLGNPYFTNPTHLNLEPRIGFAWSPTQEGHTVVRGGFGIFDVLPLSYEFEFLSLLGSPYVEVATPTNLPVGSFPYGGVAIAEASNGARRNMYVEPDPARNYVTQWNLSVEQSVGRNASLLMGYVGSRGVHQPFKVEDINIVLPSALTSAGYVWPTPAGSGQKVNPAVGGLDGFMWRGDSYYDAFQLQARGSPFLGLQLRGSYTWGKSIDTGSATTVGDQFSNSISSLPWFDMRLNRGPSDFNIAQNVTVHLTWPLPSLKSMRALGSGWQADGTFQASSGAPFTFLVGGDPLGLKSTDPRDVPDLVRGPGCSTAVNDPHALSYANLNCLVFPSLATRRGNLGRNSLTGPGLQTIDVSFHKDNFIKRVSGRFNMQLRVDAFNLLNHTNFAPPLNHMVLYNQNGSAVPGGGLIDSTQTPPRQIQVGLKLIW
jgi:hypothetical protein